MGPREPDLGTAGPRLADGSGTWGMAAQLRTVYTWATATRQVEARPIRGGAGGRPGERAAWLDERNTHQPHCIYEEHENWSLQPAERNTQLRQELIETTCSAQHAGAFTLWWGRPHADTKDRDNLRLLAAGADRNSKA